KIEYDLSSATLSDLDPTRKTHLFGTSAASKGWLTLVSKDVEIYGQGTSEDFSIAATNVTSIKINGDFAQDATLRFNITGPGINTTLILVIKEVKGISDPASYPYKDKDEDQIKPIYAATGYNDETIKNTIDGGDGTLLGQYIGLYYIISNGETNGKINASVVSTLGLGEVPSTKIGTIDSGILKFDDFWDSESKTIVIHFAPEGDNLYAINKDITFTVSRNAVIKTNSNDNTLKSTYYIYPNSPSQITDFITVSRVDGEELPTDVMYSIVDEGTSQFIEIESSSLSIIRTKNAIHFGTQDYVVNYVNVSYKVGENVYNLNPQPIPIKISIMENLVGEVAGKIVSSVDSNETAEVQKYNGQNYVAIDATKGTSWKWNYSGVQILNQDLTGKKMSAIYQNVGSTLNVQPSLHDAAVVGSNMSQSSEGVYLVLLFEKGEYVYLPIMVSHVGLEPVSYLSGKTGIEIALTTPDKLLEQGIYDTYVAGQEHTILNGASGLKCDESFITSSAVTMQAYEFDESSNELIKLFDIDSENKTGTISLNHLSDEISGDYFVAIEFILRANGKAQSFYYLIKVTPDVKTGKNTIIYPYGGDYENIQNNKGSINLDEALASTTLYGGETRFNVYKNDDKITNLIHTDVIESVEVNDLNTYHSAEEWSEFGDLSIENSVFKYNVEGKSDRLKVTIKRTYTGSEMRDKLAVINGEQRYVIMLNNNTKNYSVRFEKQTGESNETLTTVQNGYYDITIKNAGTDAGLGYTKETIIINKGKIKVDESGNFSTTAEEGETAEEYYLYEGLDIILLENAEGNIGTIVDNVLDVVCSTGNFINIIAGYYYDRASGNFTIAMKDYLDKDAKIEFAAFTTQGYIATLRMKIEANAKASLKDSDNDQVADYADGLNGGDKKEFDAIYDVERAGFNGTYSIESMTVREYKIDKENGNIVLDEDGNYKFVSEESELITKSVTDSKDYLVVQDITTNRKVDITFTIVFSDSTNDNPRKLTFTTDIFTLQANITQVDSISLLPDDGGMYPDLEKEIIAGESLDISNINFYEGTQTHSCDDDCTITSESVAFNGTNDAKTEIKTKDISTREQGEVTVTVTHTFNSGDTTTTSLVFQVVPAVEFSANYPDPEGD
ncbi:MAG: hypothetical protein J6K97_03875, partial [Clostridia bacterium]|nr:hypothetical protein [Clostridia bacterium]